MKYRSIVFLAAGLMLLLTGCGQTESRQTAESAAAGDTAEEATAQQEGAADGQYAAQEDPGQTPEASDSVTEGTEEYRGFILDNVLHSENDGDIHYNLYVPDSYDGSRPYSLYLTLPGYQGLYFQGAGENIRTEDFAFAAMDYND